MKKNEVFCAAFLLFATILIRCREIDKRNFQKDCLTRPEAASAFAGEYGEEDETEWKNGEKNTADQSVTLRDFAENAFEKQKGRRKT